jgi:hypothetical protein
MMPVPRRGEPCLRGGNAPHFAAFENRADVANAIARTLTDLPDAGGAIHPAFRLLCGHCGLGVGARTRGHGAAAGARPFAAGQRPVRHRDRYLLPIGPAAADLLRRSDTVRALVRRFLGSIGAVAEAANQGIGSI